MAEQIKRNIAYKLKISDILIGKPIIDQDRFTFLELGDKRIVRVNVVGNVIDKYGNEGEKKFHFLTIDDGSGQIKLKAFGDDSERIKQKSQGETIAVIGTLRYFNNEIYISPEAISIQDPRYLLIRQRELDKDPKPETKIDKEKIVAVKDKILDMIKNSEDSGGIETESIILTLKETSSEIINKEVQKLIEEGIVFEPRPGKVRWLG